MYSPNSKGVLLAAVQFSDFLEKVEEIEHYAREKLEKEKEKEKLEEKEKKKIYHVVFSYGTIISVTDKLDNSHNVFDSYEFPLHRIDNDLLPGGYNEIYNQAEKYTDMNEREYNETMKLLDKMDNDIYEAADCDVLRNCVRNGYNMLFADGYLLENDEKSVRSVHKITNEKNTAIVTYPEKDQNIISFLSPNLFKKKIDELSEEELAHYAGDARRNDYMFPKVICVILDDYNVQSLV